MCSSKRHAFCSAAGMRSMLGFGDEFPTPAEARRVPPTSIEAVGPHRWFSSLHVLLRHAGFLAAILLFPLNGSLCLLFLVSYFVRTWGMEAVYHRYFSHRTYRASRPFQF